MAQYKHLPIYKTTYELLEMVTRKTKDFPRDFKYSLGDKLRNESVQQCTLESPVAGLTASLQNLLD
jgi:hypothetical protein